jgi:hypothetical protein
MRPEFKKLLNNALTNNTFDFDAVDKTLDKALKESYSYLYTYEKAIVPYEEFHYKSGDNVSRNITEVGHLYLDNKYRAAFDLDYNFIKSDKRDLYKKSRFNNRRFKIDDIINNPHIFPVMPIVIIDGLTIWDYEIIMHSDYMTFHLPFNADFVIKPNRNKVTDDIIYEEHFVQVMIVENYYYQRYRTNKALLHYNNDDGSIYIDEVMVGELLNQKVSDYVYYKYMNKRKLKSKSELTSKMLAEINAEINLRKQHMKIPMSDSDNGIMFFSLHFMNTEGERYELGSLISDMIYDKDTKKLVGYLPEGVKNKIKDYTKDILISLVFMKDLHKYTFENNGRTHADTYATIIKKQVKKDNKYETTFYNAPIPVENIIVLGKEENENVWKLYSNTKTLSLAYPNIYANVHNKDITGPNSVNTLFKYFYFYKEVEGKCKSFEHVFFTFLKNIAYNKTYNTVIDLILHNEYNAFDDIVELYYEKMVDELPGGQLSKSAFKREPEYNKISTYINSKVCDLVKYFSVPRNIFNSYRSYSDIDYIKNHDIENETGLEYKIDTLQKWINNDQWILADYVNNQTNLYNTYHLFTNKLNMADRERLNTSKEFPESSITFSEKMYVFAFSNNQPFPKLLDSRLYVDGLLITDLIHDRKNYTDIFYVPVRHFKMKGDSYIELEIFPTYTYDKDIKFTDDKMTLSINLPAPEGDNIHPLKSDIIIEDDPYYINTEVLSGTFVKGKKLKKDGTIVDDSNFCVGTIRVDKPLKTIDATFFMSPKEEEYLVYAFYDNNEVLLSYKTNKDFGGAILSNYIFRCTANVPAGTKTIKTTFYGKLLDINILNKWKFNVTPNVEEISRTYYRYNLTDFLITNHYDKYEDQVLRDASDNGIVTSYTKIRNFDIKLLNNELKNIPLKFKIRKKPQLIIQKMTKSGYAYIDITTRDFVFDINYIRVFKNGMMLPRFQYKLYTSHNEPKLFITHNFKENDVVAIDILPFKYNDTNVKFELVNREEFPEYDDNKTLFTNMSEPHDFYEKFILKSSYELVLHFKWSRVSGDDRCFIFFDGDVMNSNKPFDLRYYDIFLNGRKLGYDNITIISPYVICAHNIRNIHHLHVYEKERDPEFFKGFKKDEAYLNKLKELKSLGENELLDNDEFLKRVSSINELNEFILFTRFPNMPKNRPTFLKLVDTFWGTVIYDLVMKYKDPDCKIKFIHNMDDILDYSKADTKYVSLLAFYRDEILYNRYVNPDRTQYNGKNIEKNYSDIHNEYSISPSKGVTNQADKDRKDKYPKALLLNPDKYVESNGTKEFSKRPILVFNVGHPDNKDNIEIIKQSIHLNNIANITR